MTKKKLIGAGIVLAIVLLNIVTISVFSPKAEPVKLGASSNINSINLVPNNTVGGDSYAMAINGVPFIIPTFVSSAPYPTAIFNDLINFANGFTLPTITTSTTLTPAQFCATGIQQYLGTTALSTTTLPAATSTYLACGSPAFGAMSPNTLVNDSTNTVNVVAGTGMTFKCETTGVGTTTVLGGCTSSQISINPTSTVNVNGYWEASGTMYLLWGNEYH